MKNAIDNGSRSVDTNDPTALYGGTDTPTYVPGGVGDFEMPEYLEDDTKIQITMWRHMRGYAMSDKYESQHWWSTFNKKQQLLILELRKAQAATGDNKGKLEPVLNPLYNKDDVPEDGSDAKEKKKDDVPTLEEIESLQTKIINKEDKKEKKELTFDDILDSLYMEQELIPHFVENLSVYCAHSQ